MLGYDINGEETNDPAAALHCTACCRLLKSTDLEAGKCQGCGASLMPVEALSTGRMLSAEADRIERELAEWAKLQKNHLDTLTSESKGMA